MKRILINADPETGIVTGKATIERIDSSVNDGGDFEDGFNEAQMVRNMALDADDKTEIRSGFSLGISMQSKSYIDTPDLPTHEITKADLTKVLKVRERFDVNLDEDPINYLYSKEKGLHTRPFFTIEIENEEDALKIEPGKIPVFPIDTKVRLKIKFNDPDNTGFMDKIEHLKVKDSYDHVEIRTKNIKMTKSGTNRLTIEADDPGMCKIRVKDDKHLAVASRFEIRFKSKRKK